MKINELSSFENWFAGSKVVDKDGNPLRMYHGTNSNIDVFHTGTHFGTSVAANQRVKYRSKNTDDWKREPKIYPVYLNIKNPLRVTDMEASDEAALHHAICAGKFPNIDRDISWKDGAYKAAEAAGYDGLVYSNGMEDKGKLSWVIFHPSQVRFSLSLSEAKIMFSKEDVARVSAKSKEEYGGQIVHMVMNSVGGLYIDAMGDSKAPPLTRKSVSFWFYPDDKKIEFRDGALGNKLKPKAQQALRELLKAGFIDNTWKIVTARGLSRYPLVKDEVDGRTYRSSKYATEPHPTDAKSLEELTAQAIRLSPASKDLIFYHGTSSLDWQNIQKVGLLPLFKGTNTQHGAESRGKHDSNSGVLYLAATPDKAYDYAKTRVDDQNRKNHGNIHIHGQDNDPVVLEVRIPDPAKLVADDDIVNEIIRTIARRLWKQKSDEEKTRIMNTWDFKFRPKDFDIAQMLWREHDEGFKEIMAHVPKRLFQIWRASLMRYNQVGYKGIIPPSFIRRIE